MLLICDNMNKRGVAIFNFSTSELVVILAIALVGLGPAKLLKFGKIIGKDLVILRYLLTVMITIINRRIISY